MVTVKELINELIECDMNWEVEARNIKDCKVPEIKLVAVKPERLVSLFG